MLDSRTVLDDYSGTFGGLRTKLVGSNGERYIVFVRRLKPRYGIVYRDMVLGYLSLAIACYLTIVAPAWGMPGLLASILGGCLIGYSVAYLGLFIHEAAHYNLAPNKKQSDTVWNIGVSWLFGLKAETYRPIHFQHHRELGTIKDSEFRYFFPLNLQFLLKGIFGITTIEVLLNRQVKGEGSATVVSKKAFGPVLLSALIHSAVVAFTIYMGWWWVALAWMSGLGVIFPFLAALRQMLEHRDEAASPWIDYRKQSHGAYTRLFGDDFFSSTFGGAGFNRHLLHHWEPQVSYTNLYDLESFLEGTDVKWIMEKRRTNYVETFRRLLSRY
jgi:fatty acid desaturase